MKTNLQKAQDFTIGQCLSDYPPEAGYDEIVEILLDDERNYSDEEDSPLVTVWEPFEYADIVHIMDNMVSATKRLLDAQDEESLVSAKG